MIRRQTHIQSEGNENSSKNAYISPQLLAILPLKTLTSTAKIPISTANMRLIKLMHMFMVAWGFMILVLHTRVTLRPRSRFCVYEVRPWFTSKTECSMLNVNCSAFAHVTGNMAELTDAFYGLDEQILTIFKVHSCSHVEIPSTIQLFSQLEEIHLYNSTLARWDSDAALTDTIHPKMTYFGAYGTNLTDIPLGLRS